MSAHTISMLQEELAHDPDNPMLLLNLSAHLRRAGEVEGSSKLLIRCCRVYKEDGEIERAVACLQQLLRFDPENAAAHKLLRRLSRR